MNSKTCSPMPRHFLIILPCFLLGATVTLHTSVASAQSPHTLSERNTPPAESDEDADQSSSATPSASPAAYHPPDRARLDRRGGHGRDGFDDIIVPDLLDLPYREIVDPARFVPGSISLGTTSNGSLQSAARLPDASDVHFVLEEHLSRDTHYGTDELVRLILGAGAHMNEHYPGTRLGVGNMSISDGGQIRWSRSHRAGRDADLAFFYLDEAGQPVEPPTLIDVRQNGQTRGRSWTFDVERNWALVEYLLSSEDPQVQWIFIYAPLKDMLLAHARALNVDPALYERAAAILHQPGDSAPHSDHYHVRVYCSRADRLEGCVNWGPRWDHADYHEEALEARIRELIRGMMDPDVGIATACIDFLFRLQPSEHASLLASTIPYQSPQTQLRLIELLADLDQPGSAAPIVPIAESGTDPQVRERAFWLLGRLADQSAAPMIAGIMVRDAAPLADGTPARLAAANALRNIFNEEILDDLISTLDDPRPEVRAAVAHVIHRTTGHVSPQPPESLETSEERAALIAHWQQWHEEHAHLPRERWLEAAFLDAGYDVGDLVDAPNPQALIDALRDPSDAIAFNADRMLNRHVSGWTPSEGWNADRRQRYWRERLTRR